MNERISDLQVEQLALGELSDDVARRVRAELDASGDPRLAAIERSNAEILDRHPPEVVARRIAARLQALETAEAERSPARWLWLPLALAAAAAVLFWIVRPRGPASEAEAAAPRVAMHEPDTLRSKGDAALVVHRRSGNGTEHLAALASVRAGDELQLSYRAGAATHGAIVSLDGAGAVTLHFPSTIEDPSDLRSDGLVSLAHAYHLDDAPAFERFVFVTAHAPVDVAAVLAAAEAVASGPDPEHAELVLPPGLEQRTLLLRKP